ncbi:MAG: mechanosensitive ion channel [Lachnospiraceae bacterium]|nr:mechanosensitive ion channel [Lachnospiraceae bacterium]
MITCSISENGHAVSANDILEAVGISSEEASHTLGVAKDFFSDLPGKLLRFGVRLIVALFLFWLGTKLIRLVRKAVKKSMQKAKADAGIQGFLDSMLNVGLYALLIIWIASWFGFETTSLIAVLGSAGVAIALALQGSLSNVTGGVLLLVLKPFRIGDYIIEDNKGNEGVVTEIGLFYTKLRTIDEKTVVLPNGTLANTSLTNINHTPRRRMILNFGISYESDIRKAKQVMTELAEADERIRREDGIAVYVDSLDESQVTMGLRAYVMNEDYFDVKWSYIERLKERFENEGIKIPYRQLDVHLLTENSDGGGLEREKEKRR